MSVYLYLHCLDHDPPLHAEDESGQHLWNLPTIRADIANRDKLIAAWHLDMRPYASGRAERQFRTATVRFLAKHPNCNIGIFDSSDRDFTVEREDHDGGDDGA